MLRMERELRELQQAIREAGRQVLQLAEEGFQIHEKPDRTPVTSADLTVDRVLREALGREFPEDGWLSEESPDNPLRLQQKRVWIVDPIDGTKYFIDHVPEYAISVALVEAGRGILAAVFNPATDELFCAVRGGGATLNGAPVRIADEGREQPVVLVAPPAFQRGKFRSLQPKAEIRPVGSIAYTLALVAAGRADAAINTGRMREWDVAAGVLLVEEAGGMAVDLKGAPFMFNKTDPLVEGIIAGRTDAAARARQWVLSLLERT